MLVLTVKENQIIQIGTTELFVRFNNKLSEKQIRVYIEADPNIKINRTAKVYPDQRKIK